MVLVLLAVTGKLISLIFAIIDCSDPPIVLLMLLNVVWPTKSASERPLFVVGEIGGCEGVSDGPTEGDRVVTDDGVVWGIGDVVKVVFTVASVNIIQFKLTINNTKSTRVVITRIKLVTSLLLLELKITLVVMVLRCVWR